MSDTIVEEHPSPALDPKNRPKLLWSNFTNYFEGLIEENRVLRAVNIASLMGTLCCLVILMVQGDRTRTIIVPMSATEQALQLVGDDPSDNYIKAVSRDVIGLMGTFTGASARAQFDEVLRYVHPQAYNDMRDRLKKLAADMSSYREVTFATTPLHNQAVEVRRDLIIVPAERIRFIGTTRNVERGQVEIGYIVEGGRFWITSYNFSVQGGERVSKSQN